MTAGSNPLSAAALVDAWERGASASPGRRGLLLLALAEPGTPPGELPGWSVGRRDAALLALHERAFGARLEGLATCAACGAALELELAVADIAVAAGAPPEPLTLATSDFEVAFRPPRAGDVAELPDGGDAVRRLLEACVIKAHVDGAEVVPAELPEDVVDALGAAMVQADPQADVELAVACPECAAQHMVPFDIVSFLWLQVEARALRALRDVATLASAFGWSEREVLALSPWRRAHYVELATA